MYLSKNSGSVFRKGSWFSSNVLKRELKFSLINSRSRVPQDDPTKPPLRLNIPKDATVPNPYEFNTGLKLVGAQTQTGTEKITESLMESSLYEGAVECKQPILNSGEDTKLNSFEEKLYSLRKTHSNCFLNKNVDAAEKTDQNFLVKSKSSDSLTKTGNTLENFDHKKFTIKKERITDCINFKDDSLIKEPDLQDKHGILTLKISLNDLQLNDRPHDLDKQNANSDGQIRALAEAIIKEINPMSSKSTDNKMENICQNKADEASLVIINVSDVTDGSHSRECSADKLKLKHFNSKAPVKLLEDKQTTSSVVDDVGSFKFAEDGVYDQVRGLEFCDQMESGFNERKINMLERSKTTHQWVGKWKNKARYTRSSGKSILKSNPEWGRINTINKLYQLQFDQQARELEEMLQFRRNKKLRTGIIRNDKRHRLLSDSIVAYKDNEIVSRGHFDGNNRARSVTNYSPLRKKITLPSDIARKRLVEKKKTSSYKLMSLGPKKIGELRFKEAGMVKVIEYAKRDSKIKKKRVPGSHETNVDELNQNSTKMWESHDIICHKLKPLSKQIIFEDEIPEYLRYPEYKYSVLPRTCKKLKTLAKNKSKMEPASLLAHHYYSRRHYSNVTEGSRDELKPDLNVILNMIKLDKIENVRKIDLPESEGKSLGREQLLDSEEDAAASKIALNNGQSIFKRSREVCLNNLDSKLLKSGKLNSGIRDFKGSNDVYLQERAQVDNIVAPMEMKNMENMDYESQAFPPLMQSYSTDGSVIRGPPSGEALSSSEGKRKHRSIGFSEERYELDITDISNMSLDGNDTYGGRLPYSAAFPSNRTFDINKIRRLFKDKRPAKMQDKDAIIRDFSVENFNMNNECLDEVKKELHLGAGKTVTGNEVTIGEFLLNSKKDNIMNVMKNPTEVITPKLSDNIVNIANESLAENRGTSSIDSLSMMKRVKEIVDLDLKNAEKIFVPFERGSVSSKNENLGNIGETNCDEGKYMDGLHQDQQSTKADPDRKEMKETLEVYNPNKLKSVVVYNEETGEYHVDLWELEQALNFLPHQDSLMVKQRGKNINVGESLTKTMNGTRIKGDKGDTSNGFRNNNCISRSGDSIIIYDEQTRTWKVDFTLVKDKKHNEYQTEKGAPMAYDMFIDNSKKTGGSENYSSPSDASTSSLFSEHEKMDADKSHPLTNKETMDRAQSNKEKEEKEQHKNNCKQPPNISKKKIQRGEYLKVDAQEIRRKNADLYDNVFIEIKKTDSERKKVEENLIENKGFNKGQENISEGKDPKIGKKAAGTEKIPCEHYVSDNIVEMSKSGGTEKRTGLKMNKVETVRVKITPTTRAPSVVTEINLNKKCEDSRGSEKKNSSDSEAGKDSVPKKPDDGKKNQTFYRKFEKYKTPFSDPEYEEKPMKINSDLESNPNIRKLDSWNKTLVLQEISKPPESVDSWLKDETDKMATLLLKVLQEAAEGNSRKRTSTKNTSRGNPYEAIRKKQENSSGLLKAKIAASKKKELSKKKSLTDNKLIRPMKVVESKDAPKKRPITMGTKIDNETSKVRNNTFPIIEDEMLVEVIAPDSYLPKDSVIRKADASMSLANGYVSEDIPGPKFLKNLSAFWKYFPDIGCQATVFSMIRASQSAKMVSSLFSNVNKFQNNTFKSFYTKYGPVVKLQGPLSGNIVLINRPEDIAMSFAQGPLDSSRSVFDSIQHCRTNLRQRNLPMRIIDSCHGTDWDIVRKSTADVTSKGCLQYFDHLAFADSAFIENLRVKKNRQDQVPDDFIDDIKKWSLQGLCSILFDKSFGYFEQKKSGVPFISESERLMKHFGDATRHLCQCESHFQIWRFWNTPALIALNQAYQSLDLIISKYIYQAEITLRKKRKFIANNKIKGNLNLTFVESLLLSDNLTPQDITAILIDILLIGANTTTVALGFLLYNLAQNVRVQRQLFKEIKEVLPKKDSRLHYHQLHSIKYLQACLKESLRLNIPMPLILRTLPCDMTLANYRIPHGTHLITDIQAACMKEQNFEESDKFKPERWLDQDCIHPFASVPFCHGPRSDFVKRFTEIQLWTCIAKIVRNYKIEYHFGDIKSTRNVISYPDKPLRLTFVQRDE